jgi:hypothetical protein
VELDGRDAEVLGGVYGAQIGIDEEADTRAGLFQAPDGLSQLGLRPAEIEAALGGDLLPPLGHKRGLVRLQPAGQGHNVRAGCELQVEHPHG